ncbi:hypothetical protein SAMN05216532_0592 [Streptomyces sp. 2231.1]|uniref:hypothetical protein n=1 Tax=Streptomyces sp. 2231.1 TaxID=1855347 RepID=UPI00089B8D16|nr:hypothetical protein [Streptomyces sp. 2231.1]SEC14147.1 hypothetical protein SAMN05216532_0592 [Streptomyces sp. 2231.1]
MAPETRKRPYIAKRSRPPYGPGARRSQREQALSDVRAQGRYGPELRDVLPAFVGLCLTALTAALLLTSFHRTLGVTGLVPGVVGLAAAGTALRILRRPLVRRRSGHYTPAEIAVLSDRALKLAASRMLQRDGWQVTDVSLRDRPRLYARDDRDRQLEMELRPVAPAAEEESAEAPTLRWTAAHAGADRVIRIVIHPGTVSRADVVRASQQGGVHLLDGSRLRRWASGVPLDHLGLYNDTAR